MTISYEDLVKQFSWDNVRKEFRSNPDKEFNMAADFIDPWAEKKPDEIAIYQEDEDGNTEEWTWKHFQTRVNQMANYLESIGIKQGDRVAGLLGKDLELIATIFGALKAGAIYVPLFTAFAKDAIMHRINDAGVSLLVTNREQIDKLGEEDINFKTILIDEEVADGKDFWEVLDSCSSEYETAPTLGDDPAVIQYTSGTTGLPKGAIEKHKLLFTLYPYFNYALFIEEDDVFFGGADLGWAYGLFACTIGPLSCGAKTVVYKGQFTPVKAFELMDKYQVTNFAHAPTAYRFMMAVPEDVRKQYNINVKKFSSAGEPLDQEVIRFFQENYGRAIYDHYGSTETNMIINNYNITDMEVKAGSMGFPTVGMDIQLIDDNGEPVKDGEVGQIAVNTDTNMFGFGGYWNNEEALKDKMNGKWFLTGDLAIRDEDGYFWFQGRADDVILSAGYRIGPTEVEASLMEHPAVLEAAVVGKPDKEKRELVKAYVSLNDPEQASEELKEELIQFVRDRLSKHQYPREIEFIDEFPKTQSGKIQRYVLKQQEYERAGIKL